MTPLHMFGDFVRDFLLLIPLPVVRVLFVAIPTVLLIWVLRLPSSETRPEKPTGRPGENLKIGASLALILQILIYSVL